LQAFESYTQTLPYIDFPTASATLALPPILLVGDGEPQ